MESKTMILIVEDDKYIMNFISTSLKKAGYGYAEGIEPGNLRVFMATLRRKIEKDPSNPQFIVTVVGVGYRFGA